MDYSSFKYNTLNRSQSVDSSSHQLSFPKGNLRKVASATGTTLSNNDPFSDDDHDDDGYERNKRIMLRSLSNNNKYNNNHKKKRTTKLNILSGHTIIILCLLLSTIMFTKVLLLTYHIRMRRKHQRSYHGMTFHEQLTNLNVLQSSLFDSLYYQRHSNRTF